MGAFDLSRYIWPDLAEGRQPTGPAKIAWSDPITSALVDVWGAHDGWRGATGKYSPVVPSGVVRAVNKSGVYTQFSGANSINIPLSGGVNNGTAERTLLVFGRTGATSDAYDVLASVDSSDNQALCRVQINAANNGFQTYNGTASAVGGSFVANTDICVAHVEAGNTSSLYINGAFVSSASGTSNPLAAVGLYIGGYKGQDGAWWNGGAQLVMLFNRALTAAELKAIFNAQYRGYAQEEQIILMPAAVAGALNAAASGGDTASGAANLSAQVALAAVGVSIAGGSAGAKVSIPLSAAGLDVSSGMANAVATITISAAGLAQAAGQAGLSAAVLLAAAGAAQAAGNGALAARLNALASGGDQAGGTANLSGGAAGALSAAGGDVTSGSAVLAVSIQLAAVGGDVAGGSANLTGGAPGALAASGGDVAGGSATVSAGVKISAAGGDVASSSANLTGGAPGALAASGGDVAGGSATWSSLVTVTAAGFVQAMGAGALVVQVPIAAAGHDYAGGSANAALAGLVRNFRLIAAPAKRLTHAGIGANRLTTLRHEVSHG